MRSFVNALRDELLHYRLLKLERGRSEKLINESGEEVNPESIGQSIVKLLNDFFEEQQVSSIVLKRNLIQSHFGLSKEEMRIVFTLMFENISDVELYDLMEQNEVSNGPWSLPTETLFLLQHEIEQLPKIADFPPISSEPPTEKSM